MRPKSKDEQKVYLNQYSGLEKLIREIVLEAGSDVSSNFECYKSDEDCIEEIEHESRDGFIPFDHNRGGFTFRNFTNVAYIEGTGNRFASKEANAKIAQYAEQGYKDAKEAFVKDFADQLKGISEDKINYHDLYDLGHSRLAESLSELEHEFLGGDDSSIMVEVRIMYHGKDERGNHKASVSACVNWEGPYHRSHISWMPGFKTEVAKEVEVTFRNIRTAKAKLTKAMNKVRKEIL